MYVSSSKNSQALEMQFFCLLTLSPFYFLPFLELFPGSYSLIKLSTSETVNICLQIIYFHILYSFVPILFIVFQRFSFFSSAQLVQAPYLTLVFYPHIFLLTLPPEPHKVLAINHFFSYSLSTGVLLLPLSFSCLSPLPFYPSPPSLSSSLLLLLSLFMTYLFLQPRVVSQFLNLHS